MTRLFIVSAVLLASIVAAKADTSIWVSKRHLSTDALHTAAAVCDTQAGPDLNGEPTSAAYRSCMGRQGWRLQKTIREKPSKTWIDPDTGDTCHEILGGAGSSCGNLGW
jgi:hypothetical protein